MGGEAVTFVIVCWNCRDRIDAALDSLNRQSAGHSPVVIVDNASGDGSREHIRRTRGAVRLIEAGANLGFPAAANVGIKAAFADASCRYVALLNDDAWLDERWVEVLVNFADRHPEGAGFQGLTVDARDPEVVDSVGVTVGRAGRAIQLGYRARSLRPPSGEVFGVNAAAALYRRSFLEAQPFGDQYLDADLQMYLEDADLAARSVVMGWKSYYVDGALAYHSGSGGDREDRPRALRMASRNDVLVLVKNFPWSIVVRTLPGLLRSEAARARGFLRAGEARKVGTIVLGRLQGLARLPAFLGKRAVLKPYRTVGRNDLWALMGASAPRPDRPERDG